MTVPSMPGHLYTWVLTMKLKDWLGANSDLQVSVDGFIDQHKVVQHASGTTAKMGDSEIVGTVAGSILGCESLTKWVLRRVDDDNVELPQEVGQWADITQAAAWLLFQSYVAKQEEGEAHDQA